LVRKPHANLPDTPVDLPFAPKSVHMLPGPPRARQRAPRLCRAFSGAPESTCSYGGGFRMLRYLTYRTSNLGATETFAKVCRRLGAIFSQQ
jgi:hypothetical protein